MNIGVNVKKYRAVKEVGKILMSVGVIAYVHQTQVCQLGEEELEDYDEEEVSTARTHGNYGNSFSDSCSSYGLKTKKERLRSSLEKSSGVAAAAATVKGNARNKRIPSDPWKFAGLKRCVPFNSTSIFKRY
ncbi:hypothetical protein ACFX13_037257 [Malus domestica]